MNLESKGTDLSHGIIGESEFSSPTHFRCSIFSFLGQDDDNVGSEVDRYIWNSDECIRVDTRMKWHMVDHQKTRTEKFKVISPSKY